MRQKGVGCRVGKKSLIGNFFALAARARRTMPRPELQIQLEIDVRFSRHPMATLPLHPRKGSKAAPAGHIPGAPATMRPAAHGASVESAPPAGLESLSHGCRICGCQRTRPAQSHVPFKHSPSMGRKQEHSLGMRQHACIIRSSPAHAQACPRDSSAGSHSGWGRRHACHAPQGGALTHAPSGEGGKLPLHHGVGELTPLALA